VRGKNLVRIMPRFLQVDIHQVIRPRPVSSRSVNQQKSHASGVAASPAVSVEGSEKEGRR
jgi:hypothetical protein